MLGSKIVSGLGLSNDPDQYVLTPRTAQKYKIVNKKYEDIFKQPPYGQDVFSSQVSCLFRLANLRLMCYAQAPFPFMMFPTPTHLNQAPQHGGHSLLSSPPPPLTTHHPPPSHPTHGSSPNTSSPGGSANTPLSSPGDDNGGRGKFKKSLSIVIPGAEPKNFLRFQVCPHTNSY